MLSTQHIQETLCEPVLLTSMPVPVETLVLLSHLTVNKMAVCMQHAGQACDCFTLAVHVHEILARE